MKKLILSLILGILVHFSALAVEGMWLPLLLGLLNETEMKSMGMKMSAEDIYSVNKGSLKDAIVQFGGGCTGEIISPKGLLLTNHHCGYGAIQSHTTLDNNYLDKGFWAKNLQEELPNPGLTATLISRIEDVTAQALAGVTDNMDKRTRQSTIDKNLEEIKKSWQREAWEDVMIRPFFHGNQYFLFVTVTYKDVRLVGTPPSSIGKFGADTDNWVWPRHTGDFSLFRIYADKNNRPAEYAADNVPFQPRHFLPISLDGVREGDFTLVFGFPGRTNQYLPSQAIDQIVNVLDPARIAVRDKTLAIWNAAMRADPQIKIQYASKQAGLANAWKKWQGEVLGLTRTGAMAKKQQQEAEFAKLVAGNPAFRDYASLLPDFEKRYAEIAPYAEAKDYYDEILSRNIELMSIASQFQRLQKTFDKEGEAGLATQTKRLKSRMEGFYKDYSPALDRQVFAALLEMMHKKVKPGYLPDYFTAAARQFNQDFAAMAADIYGNTWLTDQQRCLEMLEKPAAELLASIRKDPACQLSAAFDQLYTEKIAAPYNQINEQIELLQQRYMKALMAVFPDEKFYPDANSTLRCSYGRVQGYQPRDGVSYSNTTWLDGVMEKYVPGDYEFDVPERLRELYQKKDYGQYGVNGKMPVCFIGSNHTTGGNSGSPAIDAHGNLIGLNFDRVWEGTMSDYNYDVSICRNIMVDVRYILFVVDKFAGAGHLVQEMKLVHPKQQKYPTKTNAPAGKVKPATTKPEKAVIDQ
jgi:hypothetical protein